MADRGFDIQDDLTPLGVKVNIPPFLKGKKKKKQLDEHEMIETRIASLRTSHGKEKHFLIEFYQSL